MSFKCIISPCKNCKDDKCVFQGEENDFEICKGFTATNGDIIKAMFPDLKVEIEGTYITCWIDEHRWFAPDYNWWNASYKKEVKK